ncbi:uncharacterized protein Bfra_004699 [Botrytis fragariae]|uniref:Uncharacterized protein n=1 Tax=Botrytis fragariae TaxID=1964551 RepID=A0A8H6AWA3_9HELO|nr:uncharacterized protein Bfra_004699 [Botrytis fragariae]KAF5874684.1 hypothetical protein Bfra_004699 [Botrytis fragariae]
MEREKEERNKGLKGEEYPNSLISKIECGTALMQKALATFHVDQKSCAATKALESAKSGDGGVKKPLATQKIPGLTFAYSDEISEPTEPLVQQFYHENGRGSLGLRLKHSDSVEEKMSFSEKEEMIAMARFLKMSEELIEEKIAEKVVEDLSQRMASKSVSVKKVARERTDFISFDDPVDKEFFTLRLITMAPPAGEDVLGAFIHLNQQVAKEVELLYLGNDEAISESLLEQVRNCSLKIKRVVAASNDAQTFEKDHPTKSSSMVPTIPGMSVCQSDGSVNDGRDRAACTHIILLAKDEDPMKPLAYQLAMNNNWVRFPWKVLCEKCPVILHLLGHSPLPRKDGEQRLVYDPQNTNFQKVSYHHVGVYFTRFMRSRLAQRLDGYDKVKDLNDWEAFRAVRRIGFRLKGAKNCEKVVEAMEKTEMVNMGRFLGMTESSIRDICNDETDNDITSLFGLEAQIP